MTICTIDYGLPYLSYFPTYDSLIVGLRAMEAWIISQNKSNLKRVLPSGKSVKTRICYKKIVTVGDCSMHSAGWYLLWLKGEKPKKSKVMDMFHDVVEENKDENVRKAANSVKKKEIEL